MVFCLSKSLKQKIKTKSGLTKQKLISGKRIFTFEVYPDVFYRIFTHIKPIQA